jgi:DNA-binding transcriptional MerR regulator
MAGKRFMTTGEVAELCRTSPETVRYWRHVRTGPPSFKVGRRVLYEACKVEDWLKAAANDPVSAA